MPGLDCRLTTHGLQNGPAKSGLGSTPLPSCLLRALDKTQQGGFDARIRGFGVLITHDTWTAGQGANLYPTIQQKKVNGNNTIGDSGSPIRMNASVSLYFTGGENSVSRESLGVWRS